MDDSLRLARARGARGRDHQGGERQDDRLQGRSRRRERADDAHRRSDSRRAWDRGDSGFPGECRRRDGQLLRVGTEPTAVSVDA